jgi:hypothetical protein
VIAERQPFTVGYSADGETTLANKELLMLVTADRIQRTSQKTFRAFDADFLKRYLSRQSNNQTRLHQMPVSKARSSYGTAQAARCGGDIGRMPQHAPKQRIEMRTQSRNSSSDRLERYLLDEAEYIRTFGLAK